MPCFGVGLNYSTGAQVIGLSIKNNTIQFENGLTNAVSYNFTYGSSGVNFLTDIGCTNIEISNNTINNSPSAGIMVYGTGGMDGLTLSKNVIRDAGQGIGVDPTYATRTGIYLNGTGLRHAQIVGNVLVDSGLTNAWESGWMILANSTGTNNVISGNVYSTERTITTTLGSSAGGWKSGIIDTLGGWSM